MIAQSRRDPEAGSGGARVGRSPLLKSGVCPDERRKERSMNEDTFNHSLRQFLKQVGVTSQREMEKAVRDALAQGHLKGGERLPAKMGLTLGGANLSHTIEGEIELG